MMALRISMRLSMGMVCLVLASPWSARAAGSIDRGADVFDAQCAECHSVKAGKNKKGPSLFAVIGRKAGTVPDYVYSDAMLHSGIVWSPDRLAAYVAAPKQVVPGGKMKFDGSLSQQDITDLLAFLGSVH